MIERKIVIGLITHTEFLKQIQPLWKSEYIESRAAKMLSDWCWEYFKKHKQAPQQNIETIFFRKLRKGLDKELAEEIEEEILPSLNKQFEELQENEFDFLVESTKVYFKERQIQLHSDAIIFLLSKGRIEEAEELVKNFKIQEEKEDDESTVDLSDPKILEKVREAFDTTYQTVIKFPGALGQFWNDQLIRGGLIGILAPEKRGKTFWLLEFMMTAYRQGRKVAFFQAGDMTEAQQIIRTGVYLAKRSNKEEYCGDRYIPIQDCIHNQKDTCNKNVRECDIGLFGEEMDTREDITFKDLLEAFEQNPEYKPCFNCTEWYKNKWGTPWLRKMTIETPLTSKQAEKRWERFFIRTGRTIKLSTHANGTLTVTKIENILEKWKEDEQFEPDVVIVDYGDLLAPEIKGDFRHQEDHKWKRLRGLSQKTNALWIVPTQADAESYKKDTLDMTNYSEDKRKNAHVTAMFGLNQDKDGREKEIGIMRINKIILREGDFHSSHSVYVLQHLAIGRPFLGSYF